MPIFNFKVDDEPVSSDEKTLTPIQIMRLAKVDPATHYLVQVLGGGKKNINYKENPEEPIHMHEHMEFVTDSTGPVPVS